MAAFPERPVPALPCPECRRKRPDAAGNWRIGNDRRGCLTCNAFAQNVMRMTRKRLKDAFPDEYERIRLKVELDLYPQVIQAHAARFPETQERAL